MQWSRINAWIWGAPRNPLDPHVRQHMALVALLAWVGLGADGISSACYGPAEAYLALGPHAHLAWYLAIAIAITIFTLGFSYTQVIALFPTGGGGYQVATRLLSPVAGLVSGAALLVDYVLTIVISIAGAADAFFSLIPVAYQPWKLTAACGLLWVLLGLNIRGMKESIWLLLPIFVLFMVLHLGILGYGIAYAPEPVGAVWSAHWQETQKLGHTMGWLAMLSLFLRAYSMGGGTYTGLEAVSNNVQSLAEPRVYTGKWTMCYMAVSLAILAGGLLVVYGLWRVEPQPGQTLNAVVFYRILADIPLGKWLAWLILLSEAGLLIVGANTGFLGGPRVLANMAVDGWMPKMFNQLSNRLVTQNGVLVFGILATFLLFMTHGNVSHIVVLYSINVFITFSLCMMGLCVYAWRHWERNWRFRARFGVTAFSGTLSVGILCVTVYEKFWEGGWLTFVITGLVIGFCALVRWHYRDIGQRFQKVDTIFAELGGEGECDMPRLPVEPRKKTAVIFVGKHKGAAVHTLLWINRLFPRSFENFIFATVGVVDSETFSGGELIRTMQAEVQTQMDYYMRFCQRNQLRGAYRAAFGVDAVAQLVQVAADIKKDFPDVVFFASKMVYETETWWTRLLHDHLATILQRELHFREMQMVILPMKL